MSKRASNLLLSKIDIRILVIPFYKVDLRWVLLILYTMLISDFSAKSFDIKTEWRLQGIVSLSKHSAMAYDVRFTTPAVS